MSNTITIETTCWCGKKSDGHMSNLPPDTTQGMADRAAWDDGDLSGRYPDDCALSATINVGPLDATTMQAALERLEASLTDDERAAVSAVITVAQSHD